MRKIFRFALYLPILAFLCFSVRMIYTKTSEAELQGRVDVWKQINDNLEEERSILEGHVRSASELKAWEKRLNSTQQSLSNLIEIAELRQKTSERLSQNAEKRAKEADRRARESDDRVRYRESEIKSLEVFRDDLERKIEIGKRQKEQIATNIASNNIVRISLEEEIRRLEKQVENDQKRYTSIHSNVTVLESKRIEVLSGIRNKNAEYEALVVVIKGRMEETNHLNSALSAQKTALDELKIQSEALGREVEKLIATRDSLKQEIAQLESGKRTAEAEYRRLKGLRTEYEKAVRESAIAETNAVARLCAAQVRVEKAELDAVRVESELQKAKGRVGRLLPISADVGDLMSQKKRLEGEIRVLEDDLNATKKGVAELERKRSALHDDIRHLNAEVEKVRDRLLSEVTNFTATVSKTFGQDNKED